MDMWFELLYVLVGAVLGFAAARLSTSLDRRKAKREQAAARHAEWRFDKTNTLAVWMLTNIGDAPALDVRFESVDVVGLEDDEACDIAPGESVTVRGPLTHWSGELPPWASVPTTRLRWTSAGGKACGPVTRALPM